MIDYGPYLNISILIVVGT